MSEEQIPTNPETAKPTSNIILDEATKVAEDRAKLKAENDAMEAELARRDLLRAQAMRSGRAEAGGIQQQTKEDKIAQIDRERYEKLWKGTGYNPRGIK